MEEPVPPLFTAPDGSVAASSQTNATFSASLEPSAVVAGPELVGSGSVLSQRYRDVLGCFLDQCDPRSFTEYREEVFNRVRQEKSFQDRVFGHSTPRYDTLPRSTFSSFTVSLHLAILPSHFVLSSSPPGFELTGDLDDDLARLIAFFDDGLLPPKVLDQLRKLNLVWYDGGLVCEVSDQRREAAQQFRMYLRVNPCDIAACGVETEREYLLVQHPLLCLDTSPQVGRVAMVAARDRSKWATPAHAEKTPAQFLQTQYPALFIEERTPMQPRERKHDVEADEQLREKLLKKFSDCV